MEPPNLSDVARALGAGQYHVSPVGLGCVTFGREIDEETSFRVLDYAVEKGITLLDTAEAYGGGNAQEYRRRQYGTNDVREASSDKASSELIIGRWLRLRNCRDRITLCTKFNSGASPAAIHRSLAGSLERLGTDLIDLYQAHVFDPDTPIDETLGALTEEVRAGRVRLLGCSNFSTRQLESALAAARSLDLSRFKTIQSSYSLVAPEAGGELFGLCRREGMGILAYSPLAAGFLSGKYTPDRSDVPKGTRFDIIPGHADIYFTERNFRIVDLLRRTSEEIGVPMVRLAMAWAMANPDVTCSLIGARTCGHIDNALEAFRMEISPDLRRTMTSW